MVIFNKINLNATNKLAFILQNVFTGVECNDLISIANEIGFERAKVVKFDGSLNEINTLVRNHSRTSLTSDEISRFISSRIDKWFPSTFKGKKYVGISNFIRYMKYTKGEYFGPHTDSKYVMSNGEESVFSILVYLNENCIGGQTRFLPANDSVEITPETGQVLAFEHDIVHEGMVVTDGIKYVIRLDAMYK